MTAVSIISNRTSVPVTSAKYLKTMTYDAAVVT